MREMQMGGGADDLESFLAQAGIKLNKQTILHNAESKSFAERRTGLLVSGASVDIPPVDFEHLTAKANPLAKEPLPDLPPNPDSCQHGHHRQQFGPKAGYQGSQSHGLSTSNLPPARSPAFEPEFMITSAATWNDDQPFPSQKRTPRFEPPKADDPTKGTFDEKRRGPFPIAVAVEVPVPESWQEGKDAKPTMVRLAVIGSGGIFVGQTLSPAREELLLDTCNWLLGRDDLLPKVERGVEIPAGGHDRQRRRRSGAGPAGSCFRVFSPMRDWSFFCCGGFARPAHVDSHSVRSESVLEDLLPPDAAVSIACNTGVVR